jgi:hypothetical protein
VVEGQEKSFWLSFEYTVCFARGLDSCDIFICAFAFLALCCKTIFV